MNAYRHGEMILIPVSQAVEDQWLFLYENSGKKMENPRIIAEGEVTGHKHELEGGQVNGIVLNDADESAYNSQSNSLISRRGLLQALGVGAIAGPVMLMRIVKGATLKHPEHNTLKIHRHYFVPLFYIYIHDHDTPGTIDSDIIMQNVQFAIKLNRCFDHRLTVSSIRHITDKYASLTTFRIDYLKCFIHSFG